MKTRKDPKATEPKDSSALESSAPESKTPESDPPEPEKNAGETGSDSTADFVPEAIEETGSKAETPAADTTAAEDTRRDEPSFAEAHHDFHPTEEPEHRSLAATALMILAGVIVVASLTLWAAPKLAPYMPARIAQYLLPGQVETEGRLAALDSAIAAGAAKSDAAVTEIKAEIAALSGRLEEAADSGQTDAAAAAARAAADAAAALAARVDAIEAGMAGLRGEFNAVSSALADAGAGDSSASPELAAAIAALEARLESITASAAAGEAALGARLDAVESSAAAARDVQSEALDEASAAIRQARIQATFDLLAGRLAGGLPYTAKLNELAELTGAAPPPELAASADTGLASAATLEASFGRHAQAAVAADVRASAGDSSGLQVLGWLRAQVAGRPTTEQPGDSVGAITSRIAARVEEGNLGEALSEAETLPEHAQAGLGAWLDRLRARVAADSALAGWRAQIGADG